MPLSNARPATWIAGLVLLSLPVAASAQSAAPSSRSAATLAAVQGADADTARAAAHLLAPSEARRGAVGEPGRNSAELRYFLRAPQRSVTLEILDARGRVIRTIDSTSADTALATTAGHHRVTWDLRHDAATALEGASPHPGPLVLPGTYRVRLMVDGDTASRSSRSLVVHADPKAAVTSTDRGEQHAFLVRALARSNEARESVRRIHRVRAALAEREPRIPESQKVRWQVLSTVLRERLERFERELLGASAGSIRDESAIIEQLARVSASLGRTERRPGPADYTLLTSASMKLDVRVIELREELAGNLARVNDVLRSSKLEPIAP